MNLPATSDQRPDASVVAGLTILAMVAFAWNSIFCRAALGQTSLDPWLFTLIRLSSGAITLAVIVVARQSRSDRRPALWNEGNWPGGLALLIYAVCFSLAYVRLPSGIGALLLFGAVQCTMISYGWFSGDRLKPIQIGGFFCAVAGLAYLLWPDPSQAEDMLENLAFAFLMLVAGTAWGVYSLLAKGVSDATSTTASNFCRATMLVTPMCVLALAWNGQPLMSQFDRQGALYALASGALTSGIGYAIWYSAVKKLRPTIAATVQLSVPILVIFLGWIVLSESITMKQVVSALLVLGGIGAVVRAR